MGPAASLAGRNIGMDFEGMDGWRMYHGDVVPGFPRHPHRGFETVTLARHGFIDHSDSLGATARFGQGDVQWMTAGRGIVHSEMFPLRERHAGNRAELFQIWLNLPRADKMVDPHFTMLWSRSIPEHVVADEQRPRDAGRHRGGRPRGSHAARGPARLVGLAAGFRRGDLDAHAGPGRALHAAAGRARARGARSTSSAATACASPARSRRRTPASRWRPTGEIPLENGPDESEILLLQGRPIGEPVVQHGPFVMNTRQEILQAFADFQETQFGGWPWPSDGPVHPRDEGRFAIHADGRREQPECCGQPWRVAARRRAAAGGGSPRAGSRGGRRSRARPACARRRAAASPCRAARAAGTGS